MRKHLTLFLVLVLAGFLIMRYPHAVLGQSYGAVSIGPIAPAVANCPAGQSGFATLCPVGSGSTYTMYVSYNAAAYQLLVPVSSGVTSFNGRTGAVVPTANDYSYAQLSGLPATTGACTGGTLTGTGTITATSSGTVSITLTSATLTGCPF